MRLFFYIIAITLALTGKSYAYLDPGSAGLIQMLLAAIAGAFASLMIYWNRFKQFVIKIFKKKKTWYRSRFLRKIEKKPYKSQNVRVNKS